MEAINALLLRMILKYNTPSQLISVSVDNFENNFLFEIHTAIGLLLHIS